MKSSILILTSLLFSITIQAQLQEADQGRTLETSKNIRLRNLFVGDEIRLPSNSNPLDPSIGLNDNSGNGLSLSNFGISVVTDGHTRLFVSKRGDTYIGSPRLNVRGDLNVNGYYDNATKSSKGGDIRARYLFATHQIKVHGASELAGTLTNPHIVSDYFASNTGININGRRRFVNGKAATAFGFVAGGKHLAEITHRGELITRQLTLADELKIPSSYSPADPAIGPSDNSAYGININKRQGIGFALNGEHKVKFKPNGNVRVLGKIESKELKITATPTADFVFEKDYNLPTLEFIEEHIKKNKHLPEIASAKTMQKNGVNIGDFQIQLLQKIEELTLYTIAQEKKIADLELKNKSIESLTEKVLAIEKLLEIKK